MKRRDFIRHTSISAAGIGFAGAFPLRKTLLMPTAADRINIGLIGCRSMGFGILKHALGYPDVQCLGICDVDQNVIAERKAELEKDFGSKPQVYTDFRKLLENKDIDAVIVGTPDHWHCLNTIYACEAGKDVYVEKPMANTIGECNLMVQAARKYNRVIQVGQQQRSSPIFIKAMEMLKGNHIGKVRKANIWANFNYGTGPMPAPDSPVPDGVDYDMWLGPAPKRPFNINRFHNTWRHFWDYGGGLMSDWGVHLIDMALWAKDITEGPGEVLTYAANTFSEPRMRETFDSMTVVFPKSDFVINYDLNAGVQRGPYDKLYGLAFIGDNGTLVVNRNYLEVFPEWDDQQKKFKTESYKEEGQNEGHKLHVRNFLDCVKSRNKPACPPEVGRATALYAHIPNISARVGQPHLKWDDQRNEFTNSSKANALITPEYRKPWTLPKL